MTGVMTTQKERQPQVKRHIVIIGGGISGLSAAWHLQQQAQSHDLDVNYTILESSDRWGGKILTEQVDGFGDGSFVIEAGPDSFLTQKPWALQLACELGLGDHLLGTNDQMRNVYVLHRGKPVKLPDGVMMIVPTKLMPFVLSPLISLLGKLRMGMDFFIPPKRDDQDETLAEFIRRRLGNEALDKIAEPMMSGIYNAEAERQSILATFPRFRQLEREHGSLIRGMLTSRRQHVPTAPQETSTTKTSAFMSFAGGTQELADALVNNLTGDLCLRAQVSDMELTTDGSYRLTTSTGKTLYADMILLTTPAYVSAGLLRSLAPKAAEYLSSIRYVSTGTISLAFRTTDIKYPLHGFGLVIPKSEHRPINAITISSTKFDHRAPEGYVLLRVFFGGSRSPETVTYDDEKLLSVVGRELCAILGIESAPLFHRIYRWHQANPQYDLNHLALVDDIEASLPYGIYLTGSAFRGVGMPDCVYQAHQTVNKMFEKLQSMALRNSEIIE